MQSTFFFDFFRFFLKTVHFLAKLMQHASIIYYVYNTNVLML